MFPSMGLKKGHRYFQRAGHIGYLNQESLSCVFTLNESKKRMKYPLSSCAICTTTVACKSMGLMLWICVRNVRCTGTLYNTILVLWC